MESKMTETKEIPEKIKKMTEYVMNNLEAYKEMQKKMELCNDVIKEHMLKNNIDKIKTEKGEFTLIISSRSVLDKTLIEDIEKYYVREKTTTLYKSTY